MKGPLDYWREMADFVKEISVYAKSRTNYFAVIPQNGQEINYPDYLDAVNGTGREDLFYGYEDVDVATGKEEMNYMVKLCDVFKKAGKTVLVTDYCSSKNLGRSYKNNKDRGYISFAAPERELNVIPETYEYYPYNKSHSGIKKLSDVKNFLYLIDSEYYESKESYISTLEKTDYDLLIIDLFCEEGMLSKSDVERLKKKSNGNSSFVMEENPDREGNYKVEYWNPEWKKVIYGKKTSYLDKIIASGFDGVYLDIIDAFDILKTGRQIFLLRAVLI